MLGEFLSANVATPFLLFMVEGMAVHSFSNEDTTEPFAGFGVFTEEGDVGFWTGILGVSLGYKPVLQLTVTRSILLRPCGPGFGSANLRYCMCSLVHAYQGPSLLILSL